MRFQSAHLTVAGFTRNGNRRHAVIVWNDGAVWAAENAPHQSPETAAQRLIAGEGQPNEGKAWSVDHIGDIATTPRELRRLVLFGHARMAGRASLAKPDHNKRPMGAEANNMPKTPHTPGPWYYAGGSVWTLADPDDPAARCIAKRGSAAPDVFDLAPTAKDANMRLCAAAPALLEALQNLLEQAEAGLDQGAHHEGVLNCNALAYARAAISQAEGRAR